MGFSLVYHKESFSYYREVLKNMVSEKTVIITGIHGQDASYMAEHLLEQDYTVVGVARRKSSGENNSNIAGILNHPNLNVTYGDIKDSAFVYNLLETYRPKYYINLAAQSHVGQSFKEPLETFQTDAAAVVLALDAIRTICPQTRFYQAGTSELWGASPCPLTGFTEASPFYPRSPYGVAKAAAFYAVKNYRDAYGLYAVNGILCNHSGPRRGIDFATRKITSTVAAIKAKKTSKIYMGNLEAFRDEGAASDFVKAIWLMMIQEKPDDYVVATGTGATIRQMLEYVCELADLDPNEVYVPDERFMRPSDVPYLLGDPTKIKRQLNWSPTYTWQTLLKEMYEHDLVLQGVYDV